MNRLYLWDDHVARRFEPFAHSRPVSELRAGAWLLRERWERATGVAASGLLSAPHLADFQEAGAPPIYAGELPEGALVVNARCALDATATVDVQQGQGAWQVAGRVAAIRLTSPCHPDELAARFEEIPASSAIPLEGQWLDAVWELVSSLPRLLNDDLLTIAMERHDTLVRPTDATIIGDHPVLAAWDAVVEPFVVIDARSGPVILLEGSEVSSFSRLSGPLLLGQNSSVLGGKVRGCAIGEWSKVHGELSSSIVLGHSNKSHDGFVGHSYFGRWVNLGSGTTTSNLKNTYGTVSLWTPDGVRDTGQQFLGTLFGDHAKTGIGLMISTGSVIGAGANVYGQMPPRVVPPFAWGGTQPYGVYDMEKFADVCGRVMARRHVVLDGNGRRHLAALYAARWEATQS